MSRIENTRLISAVYCDCKKCFHSVNKNGMLYCKYYDLFSPKKKKCARYSFLDKGKKKKAQNLVISCSSKFDFGKSGLAELFEKLGCDGNYEFK